MSVARVVTRGYGNGTMGGTVSAIVTRGYSIGVLLMLLDDVYTILKTAGVVAGKGVDCFLGWNPEDVDNCVILTEYEGLDTVRASASSPGQAALERPRLQALARHLDYAQARIKIRAVHRALDHYAGTPNATQYHYVYALGTPFALPAGKSGITGNIRHEIVCNFQVMKALS